MNDNRSYVFSKKSVSKRPEYSYIIEKTGNATSIVDLGCGDGSLLKLMKDKGVETIKGVEITESGVAVCRDKGLDVIQGRIDERMPFDDKEFDLSICNVTIQMVTYPEVLISEMMRISKRQIITFPNFAFVANRLDLLFNGRMPQFMIPGYKWHSTGHIHQLSMRDFEDYCKLNKIRIIDTNHIFPDVLKIKVFTIPSFILKSWPNVFASTGVYLLENE